MYTNADATLYNYFRDKESGTTFYHKTYLHGVFWDDNKQSNVMKSGIATIESALICIPFDVDSEGKTYKSPKEFIKLTEEEREKSFTLVANSQDIIIKGIIDYDIDNSTSKAVSESLSYLKNNFDSVLTVSVVDGKDFGSPAMRHWELGGK